MFGTDLGFTVGQDAIAVVVVLGAVGSAIAYGIRSFWKRVDGRLRELDENATPNGKSSLGLGDTAARIEDKVDDLRDMLLAHLTYHPGPSPSSGKFPPQYLPNGDVRKPTRAEIEDEVPDGLD